MNRNTSQMNNWGSRFGLKITIPNNEHHTLSHNQSHQDGVAVVTPPNEMHSSFQPESEFISECKSGYQLQEALSNLAVIQNEILALSTVRDRIQESYFSRPRVISFDRPPQNPPMHPHSGLYQSHVQFPQQQQSGQRFDSRSSSPPQIIERRTMQQTENAYRSSRDCHSSHFVGNPTPNDVSYHSPPMPNRFCAPQWSVEQQQQQQHGSSQYGQQFAPFQQFSPLQAHQKQQLLPIKPIYMIQFKNCLTEYVTSPPVDHIAFSPGDFVIVNALPFGEDMGVVVEVLNEWEYECMLRHANPKTGRYRVKQRPEVFQQILRIATITERQQLPTKQSMESDALQVVNRVAFDVIGMRDLTIYDAEYTFDGNKLTFYYKSEIHVDFRELVKDMFARYKTRIWMKKMNQELPFYPRKYAAVQLLTGAQLQPN